MNDCKKYIEQMNMYLDGELKASQISELLEHISQCQDCEKRFESYKIISFQTKQIEIKVPSSLHNDIMGEIRGKGSYSTKEIIWRRLCSSAIAVAALVIVFSGAFKGLNSAYLFSEVTRGNETTMEAGVEPPSAAPFAIAAPQPPQSPPSAGLASVAPRSPGLGKSLPGEEGKQDAVANNSLAQEPPIFDSSEYGEIDTDEEFAFLKFFKGSASVSEELLSDYMFTCVEENAMYYFYVENIDSEYEALKTKLENVGFAYKGDVTLDEKLKEESQFGLVVVKIEK